MPTDDFTPPAPWTPQRVRIQGPDGSKEWDGYTHPDYPGLAVTRRPAAETGEPLDWNVTHVGSGYAVARGYEFDLFGDVADVVAAIGPLTDWTADRDTILARRKSLKPALIDALAEVLVRFEMRERMEAVDDELTA